VNITIPDKALKMRRKQRLYALDACKTYKFFKLGSVLERREYMRSIFHIFIIAAALLNLTGCGYRGDPYYERGADVSKEQKMSNRTVADFGERIGDAV
jgi:predicted small lipoprotein YifL